MKLKYTSIRQYYSSENSVFIYIRQGGQEFSTTSQIYQVVLYVYTSKAAQIQWEYYYDYTQYYNINALCVDFVLKRTKNNS